MLNATPAVRKQTVWVQAVSLISVLLLTITDNPWFMENFTDIGGYVVIAYNAMTIILSFLNPIGHRKNLEMLEELDPSDDDFIPTTKDV